MVWFNSIDFPYLMFHGEPHHLAISCGDKLQFSRLHFRFFFRSWTKEFVEEKKKKKKTREEEDNEAGLRQVETAGCRHSGQWSRLRPLLLLLLSSFSSTLSFVLLHHPVIYVLFSWILLCFYFLFLFFCILFEFLSFSRDLNWKWWMVLIFG